MEIKKYSINKQDFVVKHLCAQNNFHEIEIAEKTSIKRCSTKIIYCNPKTDVWVFEINGIIHKIKTLGRNPENKKEILIYLFDAATTVAIKEESIFKVIPAKRDHSEEIFWQNQNNPTGEISLKSPLGGRIIKVLAAKGQPVIAGQPVVIVESMKMENEVCANCDGIVQNLPISEGNLVQSNQILITFKKEGVNDGPTNTSK